MKKLAITLTLSALMIPCSSLSYANDSTNTQPKLVPEKLIKVPETRHDLSPALRQALPRKDGSGSSSSGSGSTETTPPSLAVDLRDIQMTTDANTCAMNWSSVVTNTGNATTPALTLLAALESERLDGTTAETSPNEIPVSPVAAGGSSPVTGVMYRDSMRQKKIMLHLRNGNDELATQTFAIPEPAAGDVTLGESITSTGNFSFTVSNDGTEAAGPVSLGIFGIPDASSTQRVYLTGRIVSCLPSGESKTISVPASTQPVVGYEVNVSKSGYQDTITSRTYMLTE